MAAKNVLIRRTMILAAACWSVSCFSGCDRESTQTAQNPQAAEDIEEIPEEMTLAVSSEPENLGPQINTEASEYNPELSEDGLTLFFSSRREDGFGSNDIYVATRDSLDAQWNEPQNLGEPVNSENWETGPSITGDMLELYFTSTRPGSGGRDIYVARRENPDDPFQSVELLPEPINTPVTDSGPYVSYDGLLLAFSSTREGGSGGRDLYIATRSSRDESFASVENLGPTVNSEKSDSSPALTADKLTLFFHSRRRGGTEKHDIFVTQRPSMDEPWSKPLFLGGLNTVEHHEGTPSISADGSVLLFRSDGRPGGYGNQDIWMVRDPLANMK